MQYFEALMLQSEHWGWPQAAASFAQAALRHLQAVYAEASAPSSVEDKAAWTAQRHSRENMLYSNLFVYALEAGKYEVGRLLACPMLQCCPDWWALCAGTDDLSGKAC